MHLRLPGGDRACVVHGKHVVVLAQKWSIGHHEHAKSPLRALKDPEAHATHSPISSMNPGIHTHLE
jgi:hypothetical protein